MHSLKISILFFIAVVVFAVWAEEPCAKDANPTDTLNAITNMITGIMGAAGKLPR